MRMTGTTSDNGDGTKRVVVEDGSGEVIFDLDMDTDTVLNGDVEWR